MTLQIGQIFQNPKTENVFQVIQICPESNIFWYQYLDGDGYYLGEQRGWYINKTKQFIIVKNYLASIPCEDCGQFCKQRCQGKRHGM